MVLLKRLSDAIAHGDTIRAVVRASTLNQDGNTPGLTVPSALAQAALIRECYEAAGLSMDDTVYFEGHGTGTLLGDPIELQAIGATFGATRSSDNPVYVASVKSQVGHQEGGSGLWLDSCKHLT
jgi:acyl transferase domain-containing protein